MRLDVPVLASVDLIAVLLTLAALVAVFHFRLGIITVLGASATAGIAINGLSVVGG